MASKRAAKRQITKDNVNHSSESDNETNNPHSPRKQATVERKISMPGRQFNRPNGAPKPSFNPFAALKTVKEDDDGLQSGDAEKDLDREMELHVRGLNQCFFESLKKKLDNSPSLDLATGPISLFEQYKRHLDKIKSEYSFLEPKPSIKPDTAVTTGFIFVSPSLDSSSDTPHASQRPTFAFLKQDEPTKEGGIGFSQPLTIPPSIPAKDEKSDVAFAATVPPAASALPIQSKPFSFTLPPPTSSSIPAFNFQPSLSTCTTTPVPFSLPVAAVEPFKFGPLEGSAKTSPESSQSASKSGFSTSFSFNSPPVTSSAASVPSFPSFPTFGVTPAATPSAFSFGQFAGSTSAPFPSFSSPTTSGATGATAEDSTGGVVEDDDAIPDGEEESFRQGERNLDLLKTGAGEEEETTLCEQRCKLYLFNRESSSNPWADLGVIILKINQKNDDSKRSRLLARVEASGKIVLNTWITESSLNVDYEEGKKEMSILVPVEESSISSAPKLNKYLIRCKESRNTKELVEKINSVLKN